MTSAKEQASDYSMMMVLNQWDVSSKEKRKLLLEDFVSAHHGASGVEIDIEMSLMGSLFLARIVVWMKLTYMTDIYLLEQLQAIHVFLSASSSFQFMVEFLENGGAICLLEIVSLKQIREINKYWSLKLLNIIVEQGRKYKEIVCECFGIRIVAECLTRSPSEETQEMARNLLEALAEGNPRYVNQVYKAFIGILPCSSPKAQQIAAQSLRVIQPLIRPPNRVIIHRSLDLLGTLHLEVQSAAIELIRDLMKYEVRNELLKGLMVCLQPQVEVKLPTSFFRKSSGSHDNKLETIDSDSPKESTAEVVTVDFVKQAAAAKCIKILSMEDSDVCEKFLQNNIIYSLMYAMGNVKYVDSQRQASMTLYHFCQNFPIVAETVKEAIGSSLYDELLRNPEGLYANMTAVQADVLINQKVNMTENANL